VLSTTLVIVFEVPANGVSVCKLLVDGAISDVGGGNEDVDDEPNDLEVEPNDLEVPKCNNE